MVQPEANQERGPRVEAHMVQLHGQDPTVDSVEQRAHPDADRSVGHQMPPQIVEAEAGVDHPLDQEEAV